MSGMSGEYAEFSRQVSRALVDVERRLEAAERRAARLDTHSGELARELLDVIGRLDAARQRCDELEARVADLSDSMVAHLGNEGRHMR